MKRCKHERYAVAHWNRPGGTWIECGIASDDLYKRATWDRAVCVTCGEWLPLGPAHDDDERVRLEVRAAELAHHDFDCADFTQSEWMGWNGDEEYIMCGQFRNVFDDMSEERFAGWEAGVLAAAIAAHDGGE